MDPICIGSGSDRISDLPSNVIDHILVFLPFKDIVRTSALSKKWKKKWLTLPRIVIDEELSNSHCWWRRTDGLINYILAVHEGRIEKFSVSVQVEDSYTLKSWIRRLEKKRIQEFFLLNHRTLGIEVPSNLFSCQHLRKLSLRGCVLKPARLSRGFQCLISLELDKVEIKVAAFEKLISSCPLLEQLTVRKPRCVDHLQINVPKLKYFWFGGEFISLCFNTPFLEIVSINSFPHSFYYYEDDRFDLRFKITGLPSTIKELYLPCEFQRYLSACETLTKNVLYGRLRSLVLEKFGFEKVEQVRCLLSLIGSSVNLTELDITACRCKGEAVSETWTKFWKKQNNGPLKSNQLKKVRVRSFYGKDPEMKLIRYVMTNSPALEEMTVELIKNLEYREFDEDEVKFDEDEVKGALQLLCKTSTQVNVITENHEAVDSDMEEHEGYHSNDSYTGDSD